MSIPSVTEVTTQQAILENRNILIVDDEEPIRRLLGYLLEPHGYKVALAGEAREARQRMESGSYALVLCDVNMPGESGMDLIRHILTQYPSTAVIMITGLDSPSDRVPKKPLLPAAAVAIATSCGALRNARHSSALKSGRLVMLFASSSG